MTWPWTNLIAYCIIVDVVEKVMILPYRNVTCSPLSKIKINFGLGGGGQRGLLQEGGLK